MKPITADLEKRPRADDVADLHAALALLGHGVGKRELAQRQLGPRTRDAVRAFQRDVGLEPSGEVDDATARELDARARKALRAGEGAAGRKLPTFEVRGTVRADNGNGVSKATVRVFEKRLRDEVPLATGHTYETGFYRLAYHPPMRGRDIKPRFQIVVRVYDEHDREIHATGPAVATKDEWFDFSASARQFGGYPAYEANARVLTLLLGDTPIDDIVESEQQKDLSFLAAESGIARDELMRLVLAARIEKRYGHPHVVADVFYACLRLDTPPSLPDNLLEASDNFRRIDALVDDTARAVASLDEDHVGNTLRVAVDRNLIGRRFLEQVPAIARALVEIRGRILLEQPTLMGKASFATLLEAADVPHRKQAAVAEALAAHGATTPRFWRDVRGGARLTSREARALRDAVLVGGFVKNHAPMIRAVRREFRDRTDLRTLARRGVAGVRRLVEHAGRDAVPAAITGDTEQERVATYAAEIHRSLSRVYATAALLAGVEERAAGGQESLAAQPETMRLLDTHADLELRTANVDRWLAGPGAATYTALPAASRPLVRNDLLRVQRVLQLSSATEASTMLLAQQLDSSPRIYFSGRSRFISAAVAGGISELEARRIYYGAEQRYAVSLARLGMYNRSLHGLDLPVLPDPTPTPAAANEIATSATLRALFGTLDYCECTHCRSVYGEAAYLVDILHWLSHRAAVGGTAKDALFARRPDLGRILLNCRNAETEIPFIDLIVEVLEDYVAPPKAPRDLQTTRTKADLRAYPEYLNVAAYDNALRTADAPFQLPFHLWLAEGRAYLAHLGVDRWRLMAAFQNRAAAPRTPSDVDVAAEYFGLSSHALALATRPAAAAQQATYWDAPNPVLALASVATFLDRAELSLAELRELLDTAYVNGAPNPSAIVPGAASPCDTSAMALSNLSADRLDRAHRFLRLWRASRWSMHELDLLLGAAAVGGAAPNTEAGLQAKLVELHAARQVQDRLRLSGEELHALFAPLDTRVRATLRPDEVPIYQRLFQQRLFTDPVAGLRADPALVPAALGAAGATIEGHVPAVLAGLGISESDLQRLLGAGPTPLTLDNLSSLYRRALLVDRLGIRVTELQLLLALGGDPFAAPTQLLAFLDRVDEVRGAFVSDPAAAAQLEFVLTPAVASPIARSDAAYVEIAATLRAELVRAEERFAPGADGRRGLVARLLAEMPAVAATHDTAVLAKAVAVVDGTWASAAPGRAAMTDADRQQFIGTYFAGLTDVATATATLGALAQPVQPAGPHEAEVDARYDFVIGALGAAAARRLALRVIAAAFDLRDAQAEQLLTTLPLPGGVAGTPLSVATDTQLTARAGGAFANPLDAATFPTLFATLRLLEKTTVVLRALQLTPEEFDWLRRRGAAAGLLNFAAIPVVAAGAAIPLDRWTETRRFLRLARRYPGAGGHDLFDALGAALDGAALGTVVDAIAAAMGRPRAYVDEVRQRLGIAATAGIATPAMFARVDEALDLVRRAGVTAATAAGWRVAELTAADTAVIRSAVRARYDEDRWLEVSGQIQDVVREQKRAALVRYALAHPPGGQTWSHPRDLSDHFLIDVEMGACENTSRIVQATQAVQLFVQRCLMNLEPTVPVDPAVDDGWLQWQWMRRYRVWEANRKVFLYPENWLLPNVRTDRSPAFRDLEQELAQNEATNDNVETALLHYLERLDDVANLEIAATCRERTDTHDTLHVVGRSRGSPRVHYYRRRVDGVWTAWEKIDLDIKADHLVLAVYHRRPHLFWPVLTAKPDPLQARPVARPDTSPPPDARSMWEMQLGWSVLRSGRWTAARLSARKLVHPWYRPAISFSWRWWEEGPNLVVGLFIRSSPEFNARTFYDPVKQVMRPYTTKPYHEGDPAWYSSAFVFNGDVIEVRLKSVHDSLAVVHDYGEDGRNVVALTLAEDRPSFRPPSGQHFEFQRLTGNRETTAPPRGEVWTLEPAANGKLTNRRLLRTAPTRFSVSVGDGDAHVDGTQPFFFVDEERGYFVVATPWYLTPSGLSPVPGSGAAGVPSEWRYRFYDFHHPHAKLLTRELERGGVDALYRRDLQVAPGTLPPLYPGATTFTFERYAPDGPRVTAENATPVMDFALDGAYAVYNWELFYHVPVLIAQRLAENQKFEDALRWYHFVFNPTVTAPANERRRFWITRPLYELTGAQIDAQRIDQILHDVARDLPGAVSQVMAWRSRPFDPHLVASMRWAAYAKYVVIQYVRTLIAWGDREFRSDRREALTIAGLLYERAREILGDRPEAVPAGTATADRTYDQLEPDLDAFSNVTEIENSLGAVTPTPQHPLPNQPLPNLGPSYFCIPPNDELLRLWEAVDQRLDNLRHCRDIEGRQRRVGLLDPELDPLALIRASAAGADLTSVTADVGATTVAYRYAYLAPRALEFVNEVRSFGSALLAALDRRDTEELSRLRARHERTLLDAATEVRARQVEDAERQYDALGAQEKVTAARRDYYASRPFVNTWEGIALGLGATALLTQGAAILADVLAGTTFLIPDFTTGASGFGGSPHVVATLPTGTKIAESVGRGANGAYQLATLQDRLATLASTMGSYTRRQDDWNQQREQADLELAALALQKAGADARLAVARREALNHETQIRQAQEVEELLRTKFTNQELHDWMASELTALYFQSYLLAFDLCRRVEGRFRWELGEFGASYVQFGHWDSLRRGLLAGDRLAQDLRRMDSAYLERNTRALEITKSVSLAQLDPTRLIELRQQGECRVSLPESLFDLDYPGHYMRRLKSVEVTVPCVTGPYTSVNCTLTLEGSTLRVSNTVGAGYAKQGAGDARFRQLLGRGDAIVTSTGQRDAGLFEVNLRDERDLPFEGHGAVSDWHIALPTDTNAFDRQTVSDVVLHLRYTALQGGDALRDAARQAVIAAAPRHGVVSFSARRDFPDAWYAFTHPADAAATPQLSLPLTADVFPYAARARFASLRVTRVDVYSDYAGPAKPYAAVLPFADEAHPVALSDATLPGVVHGFRDTLNERPATWRVKLGAEVAPGPNPSVDFRGIAGSDVSDLLIVLTYQIT